ncbi:MAG: ATP-binding protein, partial [Gloeomargarita sp. HHBFW_bins_162]
NLLDQLPVTVWQYQLWPDGREAFVYITPTCQELFGVPAEEAMSDPQILWNLVFPDDVQNLKISTQLSHENLTLWQEEFRITTPQGQTKWIRGRGRPERKSDGSTIWSSIFIDITAQKEAESELQELNRTLETRIRERTIQLQQQAQAEGLLRLIIETIHESVDIEKTLPIVLTGTRRSLACDRIVVYQFNEDWSGYFLAESVGDGWVPVITGPMTTLSDHCLQETQGGRFQQHYILVSNDIYHSGFTQCHIELLERFQARAQVVIPIFLEQKLWGLLAAYQNDGPRIWQTNEIEMLRHVGLHLAIALRQSELYKAAQAQVVELQKLNRMKDEFLSTVSHELRSPMHNIGMALKMLEIRLRKAKIFDNPELQLERYLHILKSSTQRETELINDLLDLARLNAEKVRLKLEPVGVQEILDRILPAIQERTQEHQQNFIFRRPEHFCHLCTHAYYLERILQELLHNACKYTPPNETITLSIQRQDEQHCMFRVTNTGVTIPPEERERIFDKFYRIPNNDPWQYGGTGLGLALVKKMVKELQGKIELSSENNITEFRVSLPINNSQ